MNKEKENVIERLSTITEKISVSRYKLGILQELFARPPEGVKDGPEDLCLFYLGVKTILDDIMDENTDAQDSLTNLIFKEREKVNMEVPA